MVFDDGTICLSIAIIFILFLVIIVYLAIKKYLLYEIPNENAEDIKEKTIKIFNNQGYKIRYAKKGKIIVQSGSFSATGLIFKQEQSNVMIYRYSSSTTTADIIMVIGFFITGLVIPFIIALVVEIKSRTLAKDEILPILKDYKKFDRKCPNCNKNIPFDAHICPYCMRHLESYP